MTNNYNILKREIKDMIQNVFLNDVMGKKECKLSPSSWPKSTKISYNLVPLNRKEGHQPDSRQVANEADPK